MRRSVTDLTDVEDPAWPRVLESVQAAPVPVEVLPVAREVGQKVIEQLQVTARSVMGALALECGALLIDHGWLRILGGGTNGLPDLAAANGLGEVTPDAPPPGMLIVAFDVLGGRFAVDGGSLGLGLGQVCYFAPDTLTWENLDVGHADFVFAMTGGATTKFYESFRWPGWEADCAALSMDEGFSFYPPLFSAEGADPMKVSRRPVPLTELFALYA